MVKRPGRISRARVSTVAFGLLTGEHAMHLIGRLGHLAIEPSTVDERNIILGVEPGADPREVLPLDRPRELRRHDRQPLLAAEAGNGFSL
jgi:hypothetical protein